MEKTIKYLENGEYHYATVKDVGDLAKLKTDSKDDLVTAINELFITGGEASKKPDGYDELVDNVADAIQKQQQMTDTITNMQQSAQLSDAEMQHMKQVQEEAHQDYIKALKEFNDAIAQANADALELDKKTDELKKNADDLNKKTNDLQDKLNETFTNVGNEVSAVHKQLDTESAGLHKELNDTKTSLEATRKDLLNNTQEFGVVNSEVKELKDKMDRRIWSTDLDPVREQVNKNTTEVSQTKDELKNKADQSNLDLVTNSVENLSTQVKENAAGLKVSVKKDELGGDVARLLNDKTNLLLGTRNFSGNNWLNKSYWHEEPGYWNGLKVYSTEEQYYGIQYQYYVKAGNTYTFSLWAKQDVENTRAAFYLLAEKKDGIVDPLRKENVLVKTDWTRVCITFEAIQDAFIYPRLEQTVTKNKLYVAGYKLELGKSATPWEPNEADVAENIEHNESQFNVYSDQIAGIVKKQEKMGDTERQLDTRITETAEGLKQTSKDLQDANGKITEFKGQLESTVRGLKTEYEKYTNDAIGQISDSSLNLIRNSAFQNKDDQFGSWQNVSSKATVRTDSNDLHWVELVQSGQSTDNPISVTSNYFIVKQGKVTVAVDVKLGDKANLDNQNILLLELYNDNKQRVDFTDVSISQLGLSTAILNDHNIHRGLYRLGIDRKDVKYMTVKAILHRNGDLWLTNFSARLSSIDDGGYTPNPDDVNQQILKQNTKIEQNAKEVAIKANSVDVTRDIKSAVDGIQVGGRNLLLRTSTTEESGKSYDFAQYSIVGGLQPGTTYTMSGWARVDQKAMDNKQNVFVCAYTSDWSWSGWLNIAGSLTAKYNEITFTTPTGKSFSPVVTIYLSHPNNDNSKDSLSGIGFISRLKLEEGNKATSWTPSPEDVSEEIKSSKDAAIKVASDQIDIHVNELRTSFDDKLNKQINEAKSVSQKFTSDGIEQTVKKITDVKGQVDGVKSKVDNLKVGGRNLQIGTGDCSLDLETTGNPLTLEDYDDHTKMIHTTNGGFYTSYSDKSFVPIAGKTYTISADVKGNGTLSGGVFKYEGGDNGNLGTFQVTDSWQRISNTVYINEIRGQWIFYPVNSTDFYLKHLKIEEGNMATDWTPAPEDINQQIVNTNKKIDTQTLDSANIDNMRTQGHYFVRNLTGNPFGGGWVYVDVMGNNNDRIRQDVYQDNGSKHMYRRLFGSSWSGWEQGAYLSDVNSLKTEVSASVKNLGDRVTTEVNSVTKKINSNNGGGVNLLLNTQSFDQNWTWDSIGHSFANGILTLSDTNNGNSRMYQGIAGKSPAGRTFTLSFNARISDDCNSEKVGVRVGPYDAGKSIDVIGKSSQSYKLEGWQWTGTSTTFSFYVIGGKIDISNLKLEYGYVATPWSQAPEDVNEAIKSVNTKLDVANGQIQGKVTETQVQDLLNRGHYATQEWSQGQINLTKDQFNVDIKKVTSDLNSRVNEVKTASEKFTSDGIEQTVRKITDVKNQVDGVNDRVNNLKVGGRNLVQNTGQDIVLDDTANTKENGWYYATISLTQQPKVGDQLTISAEGTLTGKGDLSAYQIDLYNANTTDKRSNDAYLAPGKRSSATLTVNNLTGSGDTVLLIYAGKWGDTEGKKLVLNHLKVEFGNVATDWSPAPEDVDSKFQYKEVTGAIDFNDLRTQQKIFYRDTKAKNSPAGSNYWYFVDVKTISDRIVQVATSDRNNITWMRTLADTWTPWQRQATQGDVDNVNGQINTANGKISTLQLATQWHTVSGPLDLNDLKTQQRIFYQDTQEKNSAVSGWQYIVVDTSDNVRVTQTVWKDNATIQYTRQYSNGWTQWTRNANQADIDKASNGLRQEIKSAKDAAINVASDKIEIKANEIKTITDQNLNTRINEVKTASEKYTSDGIEQVVKKVSEVKNNVDGLGNRLNDTQSAVNGVSQKLDNLQVGGRNLVRNTDRDIVIDDTGNAGAQGWKFVSIPLTQQPKVGDQITVSAEGTLTGKGNLGTYDVILYNSTTSNARSNSERLSSGKRASATLQVNNLDGNGDTVLLIYAGNISDTEGKKNTVHHLKVEFGNLATDWTPAPEDINQKIDTQTLDSANIDEMRTQGHYFVKDLTGNPIGGWVYVDVTGNNFDRIRQDVYQDSGSKHMYRRLFGDSWSGWEQGAYLSDVNSLKTEVTASVKNLGDRVTTEVNSITSKVNSNNGGGVNLQTGTGDCSFPFTANQGQAVVEKYDDHTKMIHAYGSASGFYIGFGNGTFIPDVGEKYTISADIKGKGTIDRNGFKYEGSDSVSTNKVTLSNNWQRISCTVHVSQHTGTWIFYPVPGSGNNDFYVKHIKIERGSVATPWSPAPEDTTDVIKTLSTKWDVANGQIQGKVTATDVNNILNGKGYATQSWAQTMFTMKSDAITLQAVRDNITNGIQNQVNDTRNQVKGLQNQFNTQTGINLLKGTADFSGSWFNKDANGWSIMSGWQAPFSENTSAMNNNVVYVKNGSAWNGLGQAVQLNPGEYTFSMWLWPDLSGKESLSIYAGDGQYGGTATLSCGYTYSASQPQKQWVLAKLYLNVTKGGVVAIRPELNQDTGKMYVASYMLQRGHVENPTWAPNPGDLSPSNIVSAINLTPDDIKLASKKINIDGNTSISGTLNVPTVRLQGKSGQIDLSGDSGISIKDSSDSKVDIGASGVNIFSGMQTVNTDFADKSGFKLNVGSSGVEFSNVLHQTNGIMGAGQHEYGFLKIEPAVLPGTNTQETQYNAPAGIIGYVENMPDASLGPMSPGGFLALGSRTRKDTNVNSPVEDKTEIVYANKALNGWDQGLTIRSQFFIKPQDADHGIRSAWVSWSAWDHGEKYPAFVNDSGAWGGICFPRSGRVTLFDSGGQYYTPDRSTGVGPYDNYWTKGQ